MNYEIYERLQFITQHIWQQKSKKINDISSHENQHTNFEESFSQIQKYLHQNLQTFKIIFLHDEFSQSIRK